MRGLWLGLAGISFVLAIATAVIAAAIVLALKLLGVF